MRKIAMTDNPKITKALLTEKEAGEYLGIKDRTLQKWRQTGTGPKFVKVGWRVGYRQSDLDSWLASRTFQNTGQAQIS